MWPRFRLAGYIFFGLLGLAMVALAFVEVWVLWNTNDMTAYSSAQAESNGFPSADQTGAFIILNEPHSQAYIGDLVSLLATTEPGVVNTQEGAHFLSREIKMLLIQTEAVSEPSDYRVYRLDVTEPEGLNYKRQPGGKDLLIEQKSGVWQPGTYIIDIPAEGMFGGRTYYQFYVDAEK